MTPDLARLGQDLLAMREALGDLIAECQSRAGYQGEHYSPAVRRAMRIIDKVTVPRLAAAVPALVAAPAPKETVMGGG